jgi:DNA polymerase-3 subunit alpha
MVAFKMAYLKVHYTKNFMSALLTNAIGQESKTKEYIEECKKMKINILKPNINYSEYNYKIEDVGIRFSLSTIKNVGSISCKEIVRIRESGEFKDFFDFVARTYGVAINRKTIESLIDADCFSDFGYNHNTLYSNIDQAINYAELYRGLDESLIEKPMMNEKEEFSKDELSKRELEVFGFYLSNHPVTSYKKSYNNITNAYNIQSNFDKFIDMVLHIESIREINTKNNKKMAFLRCTDESGEVELIIFPDIYDSLLDIKQRDVIYIKGKVEKRMSKYQVVVKYLEKL